MFIPRDPVVENIFCKYAAQQDNAGGVGNTLIEAGAVVYHLTTTADAINGCDTELTVRAHTPTSSGVNNNTPSVGLIEMAVQTDYNQVHPAGYVFQRDMAGSWAVAQPSYWTNPTTNVYEPHGTKAVAVSIANLGIWETTYFTSFVSGDANSASSYADIKPMESMYVDGKAGATGRISNQSSSLNGGDPVAVAITGLSKEKSMKNVTGQAAFSVKIKLLI
jgi:hypothetical protein